MHWNIECPFYSKGGFPWPWGNPWLFDATIWVLVLSYAPTYDMNRIVYNICTNIYIYTICHDVVAWADPTPYTQRYVGPSSVSTSLNHLNQYLIFRSDTTMQGVMEVPMCFAQICSTDSILFFLQTYGIHGWDVYSQQYRGLLNVQWYNITVHTHV